MVEQPSDDDVLVIQGASLPAPLRLELRASSMPELLRLLQRHRDALVQPMSAARGAGVQSTASYLLNEHAKDASGGLDQLACALHRLSVGPKANKRMA